MPRFYWFIPTNGDGEFLGLNKPERQPSLAYLTRVAQAAEHAGFEGILVPTGIPYLDSWMIGSAIIHQTEKIKPLVAFRPGFISPTVAAKMAATIDQFSDGRLLLNIVTGGSLLELGQDGDFIPHDKRYQRTAEFLQVIKQSWEQDVFDYQSEFYEVQGGSLFPENSKGRNIPIYFGGSSEVAKDVAAQYADIYLQWGEPVVQIKQQIKDVRERARNYNRTLEYGIRIHVVVRDSEEEAWQAAYRIISQIDTRRREKMNHYYETTDSIAQKRMNEVTQKSDRFDECGWAGIGKIRKGAGTALVGTPQQIKEAIEHYQEVGVSHFILSGFPHLEEAKRFGESVKPLFVKKGTLGGGAE
ncbi:LLM class flavin-dependent oxidoreductase [Alkalihalobacillus pseudalcaliphilus]|uniref:LLM class flavin-dependent oxidoreductase n=1 Tax=Alkalihalobacillus pseudalcaliphilus TaxID=79884 RepID=UPI000A7D0BF7|nr:LLM class flavin-dependent oxidoreductase [Alkalihalobacillus pseudalcaliphilus]